MTELRVVQKIKGISTCEHCHNMATEKEAGRAVPEPYPVFEEG